METLTFFIGTDISKATLDWAVVVANKLLFHYQSSNDKPGIDSFLKHLKQQCPEASFANSLYCMEHTATADRGDIQQSYSQFFASKKCKRLG